MTMRLIKTFQEGTTAIKVHRCSFTHEFRCRLYKDGLMYKPADYFTDDKQDAFDTAKAMLKEGKS